ncbi:hypothetical protein FGB62_26g31 [Gracilaria domingensis]|nr:hypothetical protein FGB62_26g31 [Gracilaria domingensis]
MIGEASSCPRAWSCEPYVFEKCASCPPGKCGWLQANGRQYCLCPETFIAAHKTDPRNKACIAGYGSAWPTSVGGSDARLKSCGGKEVEVVRDDNQNDGCAAGGNSPLPSPSPNGDSEEEQSKSNLGVIIGSAITGTAAIVAAITAVKCARKDDESEKNDKSSADSAGT